MRHGLLRASIRVRIATVLVATTGFAAPARAEGPEEGNAVAEGRAEELAMRVAVKERDSKRSSTASGTLVGLGSTVGVATLVTWGPWSPVLVMSSYLMIGLGVHYYQQAGEERRAAMAAMEELRRLLPGPAAERAVDEARRQLGTAVPRRAPTRAAGIPGQDGFIGAGLAR